MVMGLSVYPLMIDSYTNGVMSSVYSVVILHRKSIYIKINEHKKAIGPKNYNIKYLRRFT